MKYFILAFKKYADFTGRSTRKELWYFTLFNILFCVVATFLDSFLGWNFEPQHFGTLYCISVIVTLLPGVALAVRRLHDIGKSGSLYLICLIPLVGIVWLIILFCKKSQPSDNFYGPCPKEPIDK